MAPESVEALYCIGLRAVRPMNDATLMPRNHRATNGEAVYRFGDCEVNARLRQVSRRAAVVETQPKTFDLLLYLIENRDRVIDKDELLAKLWPGAVVSESALTQVVRKARSVVGDDGNRQEVIRTVQRRGFRFVAALETEAASPPPAVPEAARSGSAPEASVAVLPFVDMSEGRSQEHFCDGMVEEITGELTRVSGLRVAARTSSFAFKNRADDVREIGRRLGVRTVLEGSVRKSGDRLRVTAQLIDAESGFHLWSERWDRRHEDMLAIQDEIANLIAAALRRPRASAGGPGYTDRDLCDRGFAYLHRYGRRSQRFAMDLFRQALSIDPKSARAWSGLALSHAVLYRTDAKRHCEQAAEAARRALEIDERSAEAWTARGAADSICGDFTSAEAAFREAIARNPQLFEAHYYYGRACIEVGEYVKAAACYERAAGLRPDDYQALVFARQVYRSLGRRDLERDAAARQIAAAERALAADPTDARALSLTGGSLIVVGRAADALAWTARACELEPEEPYVHYNAACAYALLGETEQAMAALERATEGATLCGPAWVEHDGDLALLREHPRFRQLLQRSC